MSWIETIAEKEATGRLQALYARIAGPDGHVDNILRVHALRPHTLEGHLALYKAVLHHTGNRLPDWVLETIGVHVSRLNRCDYCVDHHLAGLARMVGTQQAHALMDTTAQTDDAVTRASGAWQPDRPDARLRAILAYATRLTRAPADVTREEVEALRESGLDDGEILEVNQVVSYFAYANRTVLGLGVTTDGEALGLSPRNVADPDDWSHT